MSSVTSERLENAQEQKLRELEERIEILETQLGPALQLYLDIKHGEGYGDE